VARARDRSAGQAQRAGVLQKAPVGSPCLIVTLPFRLRPRATALPGIPRYNGNSEGHDHRDDDIRMGSDRAEESEPPKEWHLDREES
jgi:hypothetical protein